MLNSFTWSLIPFFVTVFSFGIYAMTDRSNGFDGPNFKIIFISLVLFEMLKAPFDQFPIAYSELRNVFFWLFSTPGVFQFKSRF